MRFGKCLVLSDCDRCVLFTLMISFIRKFCVKANAELELLSVRIAKAANAKLYVGHVYEQCEYTFR